MTATKSKPTSVGLLSLATVFLSSLIFLYSCDRSDADAINKVGDAYLIYLPASADFNEVVADVKTEIAGVNWQVVHELNVGEAVKEFGTQTENRVISVCNIQYLSKAIEADPMISLIIPCRFTVFREVEKDNRIVVGFYDPVAEASALELKQVQAAEVATQDLKAVLDRIAELHQQ